MHSHQFIKCVIMLSRYDVYDDNESISKKLPMVQLKTGERGVFNADAWVVMARNTLAQTTAKRNNKL